MARFLIPASIVLVALTLYALFEVLFTPRHQVRAMPKPAWVAAVVLLPLVGPVLWLLFGRARPAAAGPVPRPASPDDDEAFLRTLRVQRRQAQRERELDRRDAELRAREEEQRRRREAAEDATDDDGGPGESEPPSR